MVVLKKWIIAYPSDMGGNINENIKNNLIKELVSTCDETNGYFTEIKKVYKIIDNYITNSGSDIMCLVEFEAETFKPEVDMIIEDVDIIKIYENGILLNAMNIQKILIPSRTFPPDCKIEDKIFSKDGLELKEYDKMNVKIKAVKYDNNKFNCIGVMV